MQHSQKTGGVGKKPSQARKVGQHFLEKIMLLGGLFLILLIL
jgi:hypothetical protein